jgi:chromosomal replication initiation ATPase DnaA
MAGAMTDTDRLAHDAGVPADLAALVVLAANRLGVTVRCFRAPGRRIAFVRARQRVAVGARDLGFTYQAIGRALNRDHSSVIHAERRGRAECKAR